MKYKRILKKIAEQELNRHVDKEFLQVLKAEQAAQRKVLPSRRNVVRCVSAILALMVAVVCSVILLPGTGIVVKYEDYAYGTTKAVDATVGDVNAYMEYFWLSGMSVPSSIDKTVDVSSQRVAKFTVKYANYKLAPRSDNESQTLGELIVTIERNNGKKIGQWMESNYNKKQLFGRHHLRYKIAIEQSSDAYAYKAEGIVVTKVERIHIELNYMTTSELDGVAFYNTIKNILSPRVQ